MSTNATTNNNVATLPPTPKAQTAKEVIAANVKLLIDSLRQATAKDSPRTSPQWAVSIPGGE
jgi:hypothetical protein